MLTVARFPADEIEHYRTVVEVEFETITGRSFVPRTVFVPAADVPAEGERLSMLDVRSITAVGDPGGPVTFDRIDRYAYAPCVPEGAIGLDIAYGFTTVPDDIKRAGLLRLRWLLVSERSSIPDRATSYQPADGGTYLLATPGRAGYETGIPDVDAVLDRYRHRIIEGFAL